MGVVVRETTSETRMATDSVMANSRNSRPMIPPISRMGMKTAISDRLMETTVKPTSRAPCMAASIRVIPDSRWRETFSSTTMASSTTNPVAMVRAMRERLLRLKPARYITASVPMRETGTATAGMRVAGPSRRKRNTTSTTRITASASVRSTSRKEVRMVTDRSEAAVILMPAGMEACSTGRIALMRSTVSMMLAPGCRVMVRRMAGSSGGTGPPAAPSPGWVKTAELWMSSTESVMAPRSLSLTAAPFE